MNRNKDKKISQIYEDNNKFELVEDDYTREIHINLEIDKYLALIDDEELEEDDESDIEAIDDDSDDSGESYYDIIKKHYPGVYLIDNQIKGYEKGNQRKPILEAIMDVEEDSIYSFVSIWDLVITNKYIRFWAPTRSKSNYEWMYFCKIIIDKILKVFIEDDEGKNDIEEE